MGDKFVLHECGWPSEVPIGINQPHQQDILVGLAMKGMVRAGLPVILKGNPSVVSSLM